MPEFVSLDLDTTVELSRKAAITHRQGFEAQLDLFHLPPWVISIVLGEDQLKKQLLSALVQHWNEVVHEAVDARHESVLVGAVGAWRFWLFRTHQRLGDIVGYVFFYLIDII